MLAVFHMSGEKLYVVKCGSAFGKARGGFYIVGVGGADYVAHFDFFLLGEKTGFDNNFKKSALAGCLYGVYFRKNIVVSAVLEMSHIYNHVDFVCACVYGVGGFKAFAGGGVVAVGEADDSAYRNSLCKILRRFFDI